MITRQEAIRIAQDAARRKPKSYYAEPFAPPEWVVDAIVAASALITNHPMAPERCPACEWTNVGLVNYGTPGMSVWLCHGCAARAVQERDALLAELRAYRAVSMTDDQLSEFRAAERARMAPMREAARRESFVQGFLRGKFGDISMQPNKVLLPALPEADAAYADHVKHRGPV